MLGTKMAWMADGYKYNSNRTLTKSRQFVDTEENFLVANGGGNHKDASVRRVKSASHVGRGVNTSSYAGRVPGTKTGTNGSTRRVQSAGPSMRYQRSAYARRVQRNNYLGPKTQHLDDSSEFLDDSYNGATSVRTRTSDSSYRPPQRSSTPRRPSSAGTGTFSRTGRPVSSRSLGSTGSILNPSHQAGRIISSDGFLLTEQEYLYQKAAQAGPDHQYFDRHSRCHNHTHIHHQLLLARPRKACQTFGSRCLSKSKSAASCSSSVQEEEDLEVYTSREVQYMQAMRPRTAPVTRRDFQSLPRKNAVLRGTTPHFCNFVSKLQLHRRESQGHDRTFDTDPDMLNTDGLHDLIDDDVTAGAANQNVGGSVDDGTEARPTSPSSQLGRQDESEGSKDGEEAAPATIGVEITHKSGRKGDDDLQDISDRNNHDNDDQGDVNGPLSNGPQMEPQSSPEPGPQATKEESIPVQPVAPKAQSSIQPRPLPTRPSEDEETRRRRACAAKKERKGPVRRPTGKLQEAPSKEAEKGGTKEEEKGETEQSEKGPEESPRDKVVLSAPELPQYQPKKSKSRKLPPRASQRKNDMATKQEQLKQDEKSSENNSTGKPFEFPSDLANADETQLKQNKPKIQPWAQGRLALSQQACRFELPMDMRVLESLSPQDYLRQYCVFSTRRQSLYQKIFMKYKDKSGHLSYKDLNKALTDVLVNTISAEQVKSMCELIQLDQNVAVDSKLFGGLAALSERVLYPDHLTEDTTDIKEHKKEKIESADFCALEWKFKGVAVNPQIRRILEAL